jgi:hypothetical protein
VLLFTKMTKIRRCRPTGGDPFDEQNDCRVPCIYKSEFIGRGRNIRPVRCFRYGQSSFFIHFKLVNVFLTEDEPYRLVRELLNLAHARPAARGWFITRFIDTISIS